MVKKVSLTDDATTLEEELVNIDDEIDGDGVITFEEDLTDAEPAEPLPDGDYIGTIIKAEKTESKSGKGYYIRVDFLITPDQFPADYAPDNAPEEGAMVSYRRLSLAETRNARYAIKNFLLAVGYPLSKRLILAELITRQAKITLKTEEYDGIPRNAIDRVSAVD